MPELPEVETISRGLQTVLPGLTITNIDIISPPQFAQKYQVTGVTGSKVLTVTRRAKILLINFNNDQTMMFHLKMTGQMIYQNRGRTPNRGPTSRNHIMGGHPIPPLNSPMPNTTTRVIFHFDNGAELYFNDMRRFGWIFVLPTKDVPEFPFFKTVGPEPFDPEFTLDVFTNNLRRRKGVVIKNALLDQSIVAGIGNIYADETLWDAQLHPKRLVSSLTDDEVKAIYYGLKRSLETGIKHKGSSSKTYVNHKGEAGTFLDYANAYHKTGLPCARCKELIIREKIGQRSAHYCPNCQKL